MTRGPRRLALLLVLCGLAPATPAGAQNASAVQLSNYRDLVERYRSGDYAGAVERASEEPTRSASSVLALWTSRAVPPWIDRLFMQAAALLHTDVAASFWQRARPVDASPHVELARRLAEASAPPSERGDLFLRRWYLGAALLHARHLAPNDAFVFFRRAMRAAPDDVAILTAATWLRERVALFPGLTRGATLASAKATRDRGLVDAARLARTALDVDPTATEAALRLGRIELERGRLAEAGRILQDVVARAATTEPERYIGLLLLGGVREREGQRDAAAATYRQAVSQWPEGRSARVALALLLRESGDVAAADEAMAPLMRARPEGGVAMDPWPNYVLGPIPFGDLVLEGLRVGVRRP